MEAASHCLLGGVEPIRPSEQPAPPLHGRRGSYFQGGDDPLPTQTLLWLSSSTRHSRPTQPALEFCSVTPGSASYHPTWRPRHSRCGCYRRGRPRKGWCGGRSEGRPFPRWRWRRRRARQPHRRKAHQRGRTARRPRRERVRIYWVLGRGWWRRRRQRRLLVVLRRRHGPPVKIPTVIEF